MKPILVALLIMAALQFFAPSARADVDFSDTQNVWPGLNFVEKSGEDQNGVPDLQKGTMHFTGTSMTGITLDYYNKYSKNSGWASTWNALEPGDFFFDFNNDNLWDYVIHQTNGTWDLYKNTSSNKLVYGIDTSEMSLSQYKNAYSGYVMTGLNSSGQDTVNRDRHPQTIKNLDELTLVMGVSFDGWDSFAMTKNNGGYGSSTWKFANAWDLSDFHGQPFTFAFTMTCANDVIFEHPHVPNPEPGTMLLMGAGALGAAFMRRRNKSGKM